MHVTKGVDLYEIDPKMTHLAAEYRANPRGRHSPDLQRVLNVMRGAPSAGKHILIFDKKRNGYVIAQLGGERGAPVTRNDERVFEKASDAEWEVFKLRWRQHTGQDLNI